MRFPLVTILTVNFVFCAVEFWYGTLISSIAIISDSVDIFTNALAVLMSFICIAIPLKKKIIITRFGVYLLDDVFK